MQSCIRSSIRTARITAVVPKVTRSFMSYPPARVQVGDSIPKVELAENSPGNLVDISEITSNGKFVIVGVPGAFSPACSASHAPGLIKNLKNFKNKGVDEILIVAVNDPFVTKAWAESLSVPKGVRILSDLKADLTEKLDVLFDGSKFFGNHRSKRYALIVENGKVTNVAIEPDSTGLDGKFEESRAQIAHANKVSTAEKILERL